MSTVNYINKLSLWRNKLVFISIWLLKLPIKNSKTKGSWKLTKQKHRSSRALNYTKLQEHVYTHGTGGSHIRQIIALPGLICTWDGHHTHTKLMWPQCPWVYIGGAESRLLHLQFLSLLNCILIVHFSFVQTWKKIGSLRGLDDDWNDKAGSLGICPWMHGMHGSFNIRNRVFKKTKQNIVVQ